MLHEIPIQDTVDRPLITDHLITDHLITDHLITDHLITDNRSPVLPSWFSLPSGVMMLFRRNI